MAESKTTARRSPVQLRDRHEAVLRELTMLYGETAGSIQAGNLGLMNSALVMRLAAIFKIAGVEAPGCDPQSLAQDARDNEVKSRERRQTKPQANIVSLDNAKAQ